MFKLLRFYHKLDCKNTDNLASESFPGFLFKCSLFSSNICSYKMDDFQLTFFHFMLHPISVWHKVWKTDEIILCWSCCCKVCKMKDKVKGTSIRVLPSESAGLQNMDLSDQGGKTTQSRPARLWRCVQSQLSTTEGRKTGLVNKWQQINKKFPDQTHQKTRTKMTKRAQN